MIHKHKWTLVGSKQVEIRDISFSYIHPDISPTTRLLYSCDLCPKVKVKNIDGYWSKKELGLDK